MSNTQTTYIDLPGEHVATNRQQSKLKVILRNHRDIVLDINTGSGGKLTLQCNLQNGILLKDSKFDRKTSFYSKDNNRIINRGRALVFKDGESQHLHVSREFEGVLTVYKGKNIIMKIPVKHYDSTTFGNDPKEKPAPILIRMNKNGNVPIRDWTNRKQKSQAAINSMFESSSLVKEVRADKTITGWENYSRNSLMIPSVEVLTPNDIDSIPEVIWKHLGSGNKSILSADVDENGIISRNWIYNQIGASSAFTADNWKWLKETVRKKSKDGFRIVKINIKLSTVKSGQQRLYIYFSGYAKDYEYFKTGVRHLASNGHPAIMPFTAGIGTTNGLKQTIKSNIGSTFKNNALVYFILSSTISVAEWKTDQKADGYDLAGSITTNAIKAVLVSAATSLAVGLITMAVFAIAPAGAVVAIPAIVIGALYLVIGVFASFTVEFIDKEITNGKGFSSLLGAMFRNVGGWLKSMFKTLNENSYTYSDYNYDFCKAC
ncbi:hypothetical protein ACTXJ5_05000 [Psychrobacter alimentarius]|uniref:hypothetical protein n=1 Tax=Psychrobacter alimentarius TaxID=261164 RepID=UPI003FD1FB03